MVGSEDAQANEQRLRIEGESIVRDLRELSIVGELADVAEGRETEVTCLPYDGVVL